MITTEGGGHETTTATAIFSRYLYRRYGDRSTPEQYVSDLTMFLNHLGDKPLQQVTAQDTDRFIDSQYGQLLAASTSNRRLATIYAFARQLINHGLPMERVRKLPGHKTMNKSQHCARLADATMKHQFESVAEPIEGILVQDWPSPDTTALLASNSVQGSDSV